MQAAVARYRQLATAYGTTLVRTPLGLVAAVETPMDVSGAVVTERPGDGAFVELDGFPVMTASQAVADAVAAHPAAHARGLMTLEDETIRLVALADADGVLRDGDVVVLEIDGTPLAA